MPIYLWPNLLSLDAVAVALVWGWAFAVGEGMDVFNLVYLPAFVSLGLAVKKPLNYLER